jgi:hypothetical protein
MLYAKIKDCFEVLAAVIFLAASGSVMAVEAISAIRDKPSHLVDVAAGSSVSFSQYDMGNAVCFDRDINAFCSIDLRISLAPSGAIDAIEGVGLIPSDKYTESGAALSLPFFMGERQVDRTRPVVLI